MVFLKVQSSSFTFKRENLVIDFITSLCRWSGPLITFAYIYGLLSINEAFCNPCKSVFLHKCFLLVNVYSSVLLESIYQNSWSSSLKAYTFSNYICFTNFALLENLFRCSSGVGNGGLDMTLCSRGFSIGIYMVEGGPLGVRLWKFMNLGVVSVISGI